MAESTKTVNIAPIIRDAAHAKRIQDTTEALEAAHRHVADMAGEWVDSGCAGIPSTRGVSYGSPVAEAQELRDAVIAWRAAGEAFARAVAGRS